MPLDGVLLTQLTNELKEGLLGARVDKIYQPSRDEIVLVLRSRSGQQKLLISAFAQSPRVHYTAHSLENPKSPPMFCMLLRKHLNAAKVTDVTQQGMDRILTIKFSATNEFGDPEELSLVTEIMGRHSNIIFVGAGGRVIDAIKRVDTLMSAVRPIFPGIEYTLPPSQENKLNILTCTAGEVAEKLEGMAGKELAKALQESLLGFSPLSCREIVFETFGEADLFAGELDAAQTAKLKTALEKVKAKIAGFDMTPTMLLDESGIPKDFSADTVLQYGSVYTTRQLPSYSELLDSYYYERDMAVRMNQRSGNLLKTLSNISDRIARRLSVQKTELLQSGNREYLKEYGDLLSTNAHLLQKGMYKITLQNYYDEQLPQVEIKLDNMLTPSQNIQKYYAEYRKAKTAEEMLLRLIAEGEAELEYIESVYDLLSRARYEAEIDHIRGELEAGGYLKRSTQNKQSKKEKLAPFKFVSSEGFTIFVGRNNVQNDQLTLKDAKSQDIWLHTQNIPGSHVIIVTDGQAPGNKTLEEAAVLAAFHSKARHSGKTAVDYAKIKYVKKPSGAKPGRVIYTNFETAIVEPLAELAEKLKVN